MNDMPTKADYAKINIACKDLGLDKYQLISDRYGLESSTELTPVQLKDLYNHFKSLGWTPSRPTEVKEGHKETKRVSDNYRRIKPGPAAKQQKYALALWNALGYEVKKLDARCHKQFGVDRIEWVVEHDDLRILITDLRQRCLNVGIDPEAH